jgi:hypothetical protein
LNLTVEALRMHTRTGLVERVPRLIYFFQGGTRMAKKKATKKKAKKKAKK